MTDPVKGSPEWIKAEQAKSAKMGGFGKGCLGCSGVFVLAVVIFAVWIGSLGSGGSSSPSGDSYESIAQCEARIDKLLKAPSTADYNSDAAGTGAGSWKVSGTVDAENGFGAKVRASYGCTVTLSGDSATTTVDYFDE